MSLTKTLDPVSISGCKDGYSGGSKVFVKEVIRLHISRTDGDIGIRPMQNIYLEK